MSDETNATTTCRLCVAENEGVNDSYENLEDQIEHGIDHSQELTMDPMDAWNLCFRDKPLVKEFTHPKVREQIGDNSQSDCDALTDVPVLEKKARIYAVTSSNVSDSAPKLEKEEADYGTLLEGTSSPVSQLDSTSEPRIKIVSRSPQIRVIRVKRKVSLPSSEERSTRDDTVSPKSSPSPYNIKEPSAPKYQSLISNRVKGGMLSGNLNSHTVKSRDRILSSKLISSKLHPKTRRYSLLSLTETTPYQNEKIGQNRMSDSPSSSPPVADFEVSSPKKVFKGGRLENVFNDDDDGLHSTEKETEDSNTDGELVMDESVYPSDSEESKDQADSEASGTMDLAEMESKFESTHKFVVSKVRQRVGSGISQECSLCHREMKMSTGFTAKVKYHVLWHFTTPPFRCHSCGVLYRSGRKVDHEEGCTATRIGRGKKCDFPKIRPEIADEGLDILYQCFPDLSIQAEQSLSEESA